MRHDHAKAEICPLDLWLFALATAYRLPCESEATGGAPIGWQWGRRQRPEQTRAKDIVFAQGYYGIYQVAKYLLGVGVKLTEPPPGIGTRQDIRAKYTLMTQHCSLCRNLRQRAQRACQLCASLVIWAEFFLAKAGP